jgi:predicted small secreted protein
MKRIGMFIAGVILAFGPAAIFAAGPSEAELAKQARISKAQAQQIALARVSRGTVKSAEIEKEKGHLVWSFDIAQSGTKNITEILVDAKTGTVISTQTETPRDQAREASAERKR